MLPSLDLRHRAWCQFLIWFLLNFQCWKKWPVWKIRSAPAYTLFLFKSHRLTWLGRLPGKGNKEHFAIIAVEDENNNWSRSFPKQFLDEGRITIIHSNKLLPWVSGTEQDLNVPLKQNKVGLCETEQVFSAQSVLCWRRVKKKKVKKEEDFAFPGKVVLWKLWRTEHT